MHASPVRTSPRRRFATLLLLTFLPAGGCADRAPSAGVEAERWTLGEAEIRIGSLDDGEYALSPVGFVRVMPWEEVWVAQSQEGVIRVFDTTGRFVRVVGRQGEGPGEFLRPGRIGISGDSVWVVDGRLRRITWLSPEGEHLGDRRFPEPPAVGEEIRASFSLLLAGGRGLFVTAEPLRGGTSPDRLFPVVTTPGVDTIAYRHGHPQQALFVDRASDGTVGLIEIVTQTFWDRTLWSAAPGGDRLVFADRRTAVTPDSASYRVTSVTPEGDTLFSTEVPYDPVPVPDELTDSILEQYTRGGRSADELRRTVHLPEHRTPVSDVVVGADGTTWVAREALPDSPRTWEVFDREGRMIGRLRAPGELDLYHVTRDAVWGVVTDELDVPYVVRMPVGDAVAATEEDDR